MDVRFGRSHPHSRTMTRDSAVVLVHVSVRSHQPRPDPAPGAERIKPAGRAAGADGGV